MDANAKGKENTIHLKKMEEKQKITSKKGGLKAIPFIIVNEVFETVAGFGLHTIMILYLKNKYHLPNATGSYVLFLWSAISNFLPIIGAFLSDSFLGRFRIIGIGSIINLLGVVVLWLTALLPAARPPACPDSTIQTCAFPKPAQLALLFSSFALMSIGAGCIRPCSLAFGADQFDNPNNPKNGRILQTFFNWYYVSVGISILIAVTVIVYIQDKAGWVVGFGVPAGLMFVSAAMFFIGSSLYVKVDANNSLFTSFAQVLAAAWKKRRLALPPRDEDGFYYHHKGSKIIAPSDTLRFLNKACIIAIPEELDCDGYAKQPWLCSIRQVEELKTLIKILPIWSTSIIIAVTINQQSFPVLQASIMDRHIIGGLEIPAASFSVFSILALTLWVALYDRVIIPFLSRTSSSRQNGLSFKERIGIGLVISALAMASAAGVEKIRREATMKKVVLSAMWLIPQHFLGGLAEAFNAIGQIEFYYSQFPKNMASIAVALWALGLAFGNVVGSLIVGILDHVTKKGGKSSWISNDLNKGRYDYYYWVLFSLSGINVLYFLVCSWAYGSTEEVKIWDEGNEETEREEVHEIKGSPIKLGFD